MIHSFTKSYQYSETKNGSFDRIYHNYFQNVTGVSKTETITDKHRQKIGIDKVVYLKSGEQIRVQEKWRQRKFSNDFLIEYCSIYQNGACRSPGWIYTIDSDYLFAVYELSELVKIYPVVQLKIAWANNRDHWIQEPQYFKIKAYNEQDGNTWVTLSVAVPCPELESEILRVMRFDYQQTLFRGVA